MGVDAIAAQMALVISASALVAGVVALAVTRRPGLALAVFLDLLLAAGLLRLVGEPTWKTIVTAGTIVVLRRLIAAGLHSGGRAGPPPPASEKAPPGWSLAGRGLLRPAWRA